MSKIILGMTLVLFFVSCKKYDCENTDTTTLTPAQLEAYQKQCGGDSGGGTGSGSGSSDTEAVGYYSEGGQLVNGEDILSRSNSIHKIFLGRERLYGTEELVDLVIDMAEEIQARYSNVEKLQVGDLANRNGGSAQPNHSSHQNGLDVDIVYLTNNHSLQGQNNSYWTQYFVSGGSVTSNFNTSRNWELLKFVVDRGNVNRIFVDPVIKDHLCDYARSIGEFSDNIEVLRRLRPLEESHDTHFHLRLKCPEDDPNCIDQSEPPTGSGC